MAEHDGRGLVDIQTAADRLGVGVRYMRRMVAERRVPYFKLGHLVRFDVADLDAWVERGRVDSLGPSMSGSRSR